MAGERALVVGLGVTGRAAALALAARGWTVRAADRRPGADAGRLAEAGVEVLLGTEEEDLLQDVDVVVKSPGVPGEAPPVVAARARGVPVWSELELGWRLLPGNPIVGVTILGWRKCAAYRRDAERCANLNSPSKLRRPMLKPQTATTPNSYGG